MNYTQWIIVGSYQCSWCIKAKEYLDSRGIESDFIELNSLDSNTKQELLNSTGMKTIPIIIYNDRLIGGYEHLTQYLE